MYSVVFDFLQDNVVRFKVTMSNFECMQIFHSASNILYYWSDFYLTQSTAVSWQVQYLPKYDSKKLYMI